MEEDQATERRIKQAGKHVRHELKHHLPFTIAGAVAGMLLLVVFQGLSQEHSSRIFYVLHPAHVLLSGLVTASLYKRHREHHDNKAHAVALLFVGYVGAVGVATLSDSIIPYLGEVLLGLPNRGIHLGFIEKWWLVNPLAMAGVGIAFVRPRTKAPHAIHVLLGTSASTFHVIMAIGDDVSLVTYLVVVVFLALAIWLPCCLSDIVFPVLVAETEGRR